MTLKPDAALNLSFCQAGTLWEHEPSGEMNGLGYRNMMTPPSSALETKDR
jgi:hypothetical protein